jgi:hypothetical protein
MPVWTPKRVWDNRDVYVIGGGKSLEHFDWSLLLNKCTIGCNDAYKYGVDISKICFFGDFLWFEEFKHDLTKYKGTVFTNAPALYNTKINWLWTMQRESSGVHTDSLGWNFNTGACAVNLAVLLGAKRIYLLGFDMKLINGQNNWHPNELAKPNPDVFEKFIEGFKALKIDMDKKHPEIEVINITDDSDLNLYPKIGVKEFWGK